MIIKLKENGKFMLISFISSKEDSDETRTMCTKSDNIGIMMVSETDKIIE